MRVRTFELRLIAAILVALWATAALLVLVGYHPGGPIDRIVGLVACLTVPIAAAGLRWPPVARSGRAFAAMAWLGVAATLLLVPSLWGLIEQLRSRGPQTLLPSAEAAYPFALALFATGLFSGLGLARRRLGSGSARRHRLARGAFFALAMTFLVGGSFAAAAVANDLALADRPIAGSRYGPTTPDVDPPSCVGELSAGSTAAVSMTLFGRLDRLALGEVQLAGVRDRRDFRWSAQVATEQALGLYGAARIGERHWTLEPRSTWQWTTLDLAGLDLDAQVVRIALDGPSRVAAEDRGVATIEGARARQCRIALDGPTFLAAFPAAGWFLGSGPDLGRWRGELDYWVFLDGTLGRASGSVNGPASGAGLAGVQATLSVTMNAVDRGLPLSVRAPVR